MKFSNSDYFLQIREKECPRGWYGDVGLFFMHQEIANVHHDHSGDPIKLTSTVTCACKREDGLLWMDGWYLHQDKKWVEVGPGQGPEEGEKENYSHILAMMGVDSVEVWSLSLPS